jgi:hypothetical protein
LESLGITVVDAQGFLTYARRAIRGREYAKFVFTRGLSDALEELVTWGRRRELGRLALSFLKLDEIFGRLTDPVLTDEKAFFLSRGEVGEETVEFANILKLGYLIRDVGDVHVGPVQRSTPNFIGQGRLEAQVVEIETETMATIRLHKRIVCIENADPGFDWIFTKGIAGLITKYGGANSHMAIRCAEFGLPAAIGCGEDLYGNIITAGMVELDVTGKVVRPIRAN